MSEELRELYQQVILDHNRHPNNYKQLPCPTHTAEGYNPLCGDRIVLAMALCGDIIKEIGFQGSGCAISKASASIMTSAVNGKTVGEANILFQKFQTMITSDLGTRLDRVALGKLAIFAGVREFPSRVKCASLAWHTLLSALNEPVSTQ